MRRWTAAGVTLSLLASGGCAILGGGQDPCSFPASASSAFPSDTLEDWVTYVDHAVVLRGVEELERDGREVVRLRTERTLWSRPQAPAPAPAEAFASPRHRYDAAEARPDHQYLLVGAWWDSLDDDDPDWVRLELLAFYDGVVGRGSRGCDPSTSDEGSGRAAVWGRAEAEVADLLRQTPPDPAAVPFMDLDPADRYQEVAAAR